MVSERGECPPRTRFDGSQVDSEARSYHPHISTRFQTSRVLQIGQNDFSGQRRLAVVSRSVVRSALPGVIKRIGSMDTSTSMTMGAFSFNSNAAIGPLHTPLGRDESHRIDFSHPTNPCSTGRVIVLVDLEAQAEQGGPLTAARIIWSLSARDEFEESIL